ncbi:uncharacterized protein LOC132200836 [Neocloeon triangulifer]|uniref:uncharacterized protein LOC132200836 n=1 Tax=Neocloeon triangulifer TaxID=2078957 RepID=UPI00286F0ACD|nr:uncharacterized protein LOC132200836 [Neocloeon triangulifer]
MSVEEGLIIGMGNPLLDMLVVGDEDLLSKYGLDANNACLAEEKHKPMYEELVENYVVEYIAGGAVQNSLRVAQWLLQKPRVAVFFGCVGKDKFSDILKSKAEEDGVVARYQYNDTTPTGTCAVIVTGTGNSTHRSLCANLAAANCFTPDHLQVPENLKSIETAKYFYVSGFFLTVSPDSMLVLAKHALEQKKLFTMNLSAPFICQFYKEPQMSAFPYIDILFGNESEALAFSEAQNLGTKDIKEITLKIAALPKLGSSSRIAVITQGHDPVLVAQDGKLTEYVVPQLPAEKIVDTNGAGDAFVGGFLAQLVQGKPMDVCVKCGIWAASEIIQRSGCAFYGNPSFTE